MAQPTKKISALSEATSSTISDSIPIVQGGANKRIHPASGGGLDADLLDGMHGATITAMLRGYIDGLICSNAIDTEHDITIAAGCARDSTNVMMLTLAAPITKQIDAAWAAGDNAGGMDTGAVANNSVYYIWLIRKDSDGSIDALFSLSSTAPTMPAGYTYKRRIMTVCTDASANIIATDQYGEFVKFRAPITDRALANLANTNRNAYAITAPSGMFGRILAQIRWAGTTSTQYLWVDDSLRADAAASASNSNLRVAIQYDTQGLIIDLMTDGSRQIYARGNSSSIEFELITIGWIDDRGRNA